MFLEQLIWVQPQIDRANSQELLAIVSRDAGLIGRAPPERLLSRV